MKQFACLFMFLLWWGTASAQVAGEKVTTFSLPTAEGKVIALDAFLKGKKLVLIDFWASWCGPCRKEAKNVKAIYQEFKSKGFDVLGVSLDTKREAWVKAYTDDGMAWTQVSDLQGWKSPVVKQYGIQGVPYLMVVDGEGTLLAVNVRGEELRELVSRNLK